MEEKETEKWRKEDSEKLRSGGGKNKKQKKKTEK